MLLMLMIPPGAAEPGTSPEETQEANVDTTDPVHEEPGSAPLEPMPVEPGFLTKTLENGMRVSVLTDPSQPIVATQIWVEIGSAHESNEEKGFAHLFEHLMFGETSNHSKEDYNRLHVEHGGSENAYTAFDNTVYISEIVPEAHGDVLALESDRFQNLILDQDNLDNEKKIVTEELRLRGENNPFARLLISTLAAFFGKHPYAHSPAGTKEDIAAANLALTKKFYTGYYTPDNLHIVVVGPVNGEETLARVTEGFAGIQRPSLEKKEIPSFDDWTFPVDRIVLADDIPPVKVAAHVYPLPPAKHPDYWALKVLGTMISGSAMDRFQQSLVVEKKKAVEAMSAHVDEFSAGGLFLFASISLPTRSQGKAFRLIQESLDELHLAEWRTEENLEAARRALMREELERKWYAAEQADRIGWMTSRLNDPTLGVEGTVTWLEQVTIEDIERVWNTHIVEASPVEVFIKRGKTK